MAQVVTVVSGDSVHKILTRRGFKEHGMQDWLAKVRRTNPHLGNLARIWPGDQILVPESLIEVIPDYQIWRNAFSAIPQSLKKPHAGNTALYFTMPGDSVDGVAQNMFANGNSQRLSPSAKRALLLFNNPVLRSYLVPDYLPGGLTLNITPVMLADRQVQFWQAEGPLFENWVRQFDPNVRGLFRDTDPQTTLELAHISEQLKAAGAAVGINDRMDVANAAPEVRMRSLFEEGFGVLGGAIGTKLGVGVGAWIAISVLGLGPFGLFVAVFVCASAGGIVLGNGGKWFGSEAYDAGGILENRIYHSIDDLVGAFK